MKTVPHTFITTMQLCSIISMH